MLVCTVTIVHEIKVQACVVCSVSALINSFTTLLCTGILLQLVNQIAKPRWIFYEFMYPIKKVILNVFLIKLKRVIILTVDHPIKILLESQKQPGN